MTRQRRSPGEICTPPPSFAFPGPSLPLLPSSLPKHIHNIHADNDDVAGYDAACQQKQLHQRPQTTRRKGCRTSFPVPDQTDREKTFAGHGHGRSSRFGHTRQSPFSQLGGTGGADVWTVQVVGPQGAAQPQAANGGPSLFVVLDEVVAPSVRAVHARAPSIYLHQYISRSSPPS